VGLAESQVVLRDALFFLAASQYEVVVAFVVVVAVPAENRVVEAELFYSAAEDAVKFVHALRSREQAGSVDCLPFFAVGLETNFL
jgi:hypothetical protein